MSKSKQRLGVILVMLVASIMMFTGCEYLGLGQDDNGVQLPSMVDRAEGAELTRDEKGLNKIDHQYLAYGKEKWNQFLSAVDNFGEQSGSYLEEIAERADKITENKTYLDSKNKLVKAITNIERVNPDELPEAFKNVFGKLFLATNRFRHLISTVEQKNGENLPAAFDATNAEILPLKEEIDKFIETVESDGLEAAAKSITPIDWEAETNRKVELRNTMNVYDYGLKWGASQWEVMGIEGIREDGFKADTLSYDTVVYQYNAVRTYHFNEYGQLNSYSYTIDPTSFDRGRFEDPLYDDVYELSALVMYYFVLDEPALPQHPVDDGAGNLVVNFDQPSEIVVLQGNQMTGEITLHVQGKTIED